MKAGAYRSLDRFCSLSIAETALMMEKYQHVLFAVRSMFTILLNFQEVMIALYCVIFGNGISMFLICV